MGSSVSVKERRKPRLMVQHGRGGVKRHTKGFSVRGPRKKKKSKITKEVAAKEGF